MTYVMGEFREEVARITFQDGFLNDLLQEPLHEQLAPSRIKSVLDIGCGTGGWLRCVAGKFEWIERLVGVDINKKMLDIARSQTLDDRIQFTRMDVIGKIDFPDHSFDLINIRFGSSFLRSWDWPRCLEEFTRILVPGGTLRITESACLQSNSEALTLLTKWGSQAFYASGHYFKEDQEGIAASLPPLLRRFGLQGIQQHSHSFSFGERDKAFSEDIRQIYQFVYPHLRRFTRLEKNYEETYQQALTDMHQKGFVATWKFTVLWGETCMS